jgi:ADP-ribosylglycohydrolase
MDKRFQITKQVSSDGYVVHTLEASIWSFMTTDNYKDAVLKAVNLGKDTDTTGAVTGGLAGLCTMVTKTFRWGGWMKLRGRMILRSWVGGWGHAYI